MNAALFQKHDGIGRLNATRGLRRKPCYDLEGQQRQAYRENAHQRSKGRRSSPNMADGDAPFAAGNRSQHVILPTGILPRRTTHHSPEGFAKRALGFVTKF